MAIYFKSNKYAIKDYLSHMWQFLNRIIGKSVRFNYKGIPSHYATAISQ